MMLAEGRLVIAADSWMVRAKDLPTQEREALGFEYDEDGAALGRRVGRAHTVFVTKSLLELFEEFREPTTAALAIARYAARTNQAAERVLDDSFRTLMNLRQIGLIAPEGEIAASGPVYAPGDTLGRWRVQRCLQSYDESDVYLAKGNAGELVVCKLARRPRDKDFRHQLRREAAALRLLARRGISAPTAVALTADEHGRSLLVMSYVDGYRVDHRAPTLRQASKSELVLMCGRTIRALALMHERGLLHGDVHGGNYLLANDGEIVAIDFSDASSIDKPRMRRGVPRLMDPQWARAKLANEGSPLNSPEAEQYSMAALVYFLLTGEHHYDRASTVESLCIALAHGKLSERFNQLFTSSSSSVWAVLRRALDVDPSKRWLSLTEFACAFDAAAASFDGAPDVDKSVGRHNPRARFADLLDPSLLMAGSPGPSMATGASGTATALLLGSTRIDDPTLLAWADLWSEESLAEVGRASAGTSPATPGTHGGGEENANRGGIWHGRLGVLSSRLAISHVLDDRQTRDAALDDYLRDHATYLHDSAPGDLTHGLAACLLMDAHLLGLLGDTSGLRAAGVRTSKALTDTMTQSSQRPGLAHGTSGHILALLAWHAASNEPLSNAPRIGDRLSQISADVRSAVQGGSHSTQAWWRPGWEASWCNGATGLVLLFLAAAAALGEPEYLDDAEAAMQVALGADPRGYDLCCGVAGRAYALGRLGRATGVSAWSRRAEGEARQLEHGLLALEPHGLTKGRAGAWVVANSVAMDGFFAPLIDVPPSARACGGRREVQGAAEVVA